jgi:hypothetical protein
LGGAFSEIFLDRAGRFDLSSTLRGHLVARSGTAFMVASGDDFEDSYFDFFRDPADDFVRLIGASERDAGTRPVLELFRGRFSRMLTPFDEKSRCGSQIGPVPNALLTVLHSDNFAGAEGTRHWPNEQWRSQCGKCGETHVWGSAITVLDPPQVWAFQFLGAQCQSVFAPLDFLVSAGEHVVAYVLASYVRIEPVGEQARHCTALVRKSGTVDDARMYNDRTIRDVKLPIAGEGDVVNDQIVMAFYVRLA